MSKQLDSGSSLREKLVNGANVLQEYVSCTLGPRGQNVIIKDKERRPVITKDGVTVAKNLSLSDPVENLAVDVIKQASAKTNVDAGDGTSTSTVIACAILNYAQSHIASSVNPVHIKRGLDVVTEAICAELEVLAKPISSLSQIADIASISANNDDVLGALIADAVSKVGKDGSITVEEARSLETTLDLVEGFRFDSGYCATAFITDDRRGTVNYEEPIFLLTDYKLETVDQILPTLEIASRESRPLVIVADDIEGQALAALIMNAIRGTMKVAAVKAPRYGEERRNIMDDLSLSVGAKYFRRSAGDDLRTVSLTDFGQAKSIEISKSLTTIVGGTSNHNLIDDRITALKEEVSAAESLPAAERIQERITRLASGIAVVRVGGATEIEVVERRHRIEDALEAVRSAQQEGILPGGGTSLLKALQRVTRSSDEVPSNVDAAQKILKSALEEPFRMMSNNAAVDFDVESMLQQILEDQEFEVGYDFYNKGLTNMLEAGIIDPAKVLRCALQNAVSAAGTLITTNHAIIEN